MGLEERLSMGCERVYTKRRPGVAAETRFEIVRVILCRICRAQTR